MIFAHSPKYHLGVILVLLIVFLSLKYDKLVLWWYCREKKVFWGRIFTPDNSSVLIIPNVKRFEKRISDQCGWITRCRDRSFISCREYLRWLDDVTVSVQNKQLISHSYQIPHKTKYPQHFKRNSDHRKNTNLEPTYCILTCECCIENSYQIQIRQCDLW